MGVVRGEKTMGLSWQQGPLAPGAIGRKPLPGIAGGLPTSRNPSVESRKTAKSSLNGGSWRRCVSNSRVWLCEHRWLNVRCIEIQICHAAQVETRAGEHLQHEGVRSGKRRTEPRRRDFACRHVPRQNAFLRRSAHTVLLRL